LTLILQQVLNGVMLGAVYVTVALAFNLTIGILNFLNFTIPPLFMISALIAWASAQYGLPFGICGPLNWVAAIGLGIVVAVLCSLVVERFTFRYMKARYGDATEHAIPLVSSLGFLLIIENIARVAYGTEPHRFITPFKDTNLHIGPLIVSVPQLLSLFLALAIVFGLSRILKYTRTGRALRSIAENPDASLLMGVEVGRIVPVVFILSGLLCGVAGSIFAINYGQVYSGMGNEVGNKAIAGMVLGGLGSIWGAIAGGVLVGVVETMSVHFFGGETVQAIVWGLLLVALILRPQGIFGHHAIGKGKL
jgi:branched-chain amino acid transport system permease protein